MTETNHLGATHLARIVDARVRVCVQDNDIAGTGKGGNHAKVGNKAGREDDRVAAAVKVGQVLFQVTVPGKGAIGHTRPGRAGPFLLQA